MQQMFLGLGAGAKKTYVDDIFSTFLRKSTGATATVVNGIDLSGEGGLVWTKSRSNTFQHVINDSIRGANHILASNTDTGSVSGYAGSNTFTSTGYSIAGGDATNNASGYTYVDWSFRKAPGFFDVVSWTGNNASNRAISHSLGSVPGLILVKATSTTKEWHVWHRDQHGKVGVLDTTAAFFSNASRFPTTPTSTNFYIGNDSALNANSTDYVAYVFAGGESTAATARSVVFSSTGNNDGAKSLTIAGSSGTNFGSGDFTMECWFKDTRTSDTSGLDTIFAMSDYTTSSGNNSFSIYTREGGFLLFNRTSGSFSTQINTTGGGGFTQTGLWHHFAWTRSGSGSNNNTIWVDGILHGTFTNTLSYTDGQNFYIGGNNYDNTGTPNKYGFNGNISNVRITKGQAIYTSAFRPSYEPLTTTTGGATASNVKVICCNNSSITGSSLTSGTITSTNTPTASTDSPFDDPAGFAFGENEDQNVIKTGSWTGSGTAGLEVNIGFEPQWIMFKNASAAYNWYILDVMRGIVSDGDDTILSANTTSADFDSSYIDITPTGFKVQTSHVLANGSGSTYIFLALRRPDGYVGKPADAGTDVFNIANYDSTLPAFNANFPVDFAFFRRRTSTYDWRTCARLMQNKYLKTNTNGVETHENDYKFDYNDGWNAQAGYANTELSWMWKRHAGFDVVTYTGNELAGRSIPHSLGVTPEMMWLKYRNPSGYNEDWAVYHKGLNGGVNPQDYAIRLDSDNPEYNSLNDWFDTAPTSTHFTIGNDGRNNRDGSDYIVMLFASVAGISKVGYYNGTGSSNHSITTGFQPRLIILKAAHRADGYGGGWNEFDTVRGINAGNEYPMRLNYDSAENSLNHQDYIDLDSDGFTIQSSALSFNGSNARYIYYAHA